MRSWGRSSPPSAKWSESRTTTPDHHLYYQTYFTIIILSGWLETFPHLAWVEVDNLLIGKKLARGHLPCNLSQRWCSLWCWSWIFTKVIDGIEPTMVGSMSMTRSREMFPALKWSAQRPKLEFLHGNYHYQYLIIRDLKCDMFLYLLKLLLSTLQRLKWLNHLKKGPKASSSILSKTSN